MIRLDNQAGQCESAIYSKHQLNDSMQRGLRDDDDVWYRDKNCICTVMIM